MRRDLAGRAVLVAAGVGTALGATAGLASAAPLENDLQQGPSGQNAFDQSMPTDALQGGLSQAPVLSMAGGQSTATADKSADAGTVSPDAIAGLGSNGMLSGLGSNQGQAEESDATESAPTDSATDSSKATESAPTESASDSSKATESAPSSSKATESGTQGGSTGADGVTRYGGPSS